MSLILRPLNQTDEKAFLEGFKEWEGEGADSSILDLDSNNTRGDWIS
jgi:hypothetical protein